MGEAKRRKLLDPNYGKVPKVKSNLDELKEEFIKYSSIASYLQYFIEISVNTDEKPWEGYVFNSLKARSVEMRQVNPSSINEILATHGHNPECQSNFLVLGLSAICKGLFSYINESIASYPSLESLIKSFDTSEVENIAANNEKYKDQQLVWLDSFSNM